MNSAIDPENRQTIHLTVADTGSDQPGHLLLSDARQFSARQEKSGKQRALSNRLEVTWIGEGSMVHYKLDDIPILTPDYGTGYMRSVKAGEMEIGATWVKCGGIDTTELYKGLPNDSCPCDHYGYVFSGSFRIRYDDGSEEVVKEGEVYYIPKGHVFLYDEPCHHLEINPHAQLQLLMRHFNKQLAAGAKAEAPAKS